MGDVDGEPEANPHPGVLTNNYPSSVVYVFSSGIQILQSYGWFILLGIIVVLYLRKKFESTWHRWQNNREELRHKKYDAGTAQSRLEAMERSRQKLQEQLNTQAADQVEKQTKREEEKRKKKIEDWEDHLEGKGYRSKYRPNEDAGTSNSQPKPKAKKPLRQNDYNPLMGGGGGAASFRPARRGGAGGG